MLDLNNKQQQVLEEKASWSNNDQTAHLMGCELSGRGGGAGF